MILDYYSFYIYSGVKKRETCKNHSQKGVLHDKVNYRWGSYVYSFNCCLKEILKENKTTKEKKCYQIMTKDIIFRVASDSWFLNKWHTACKLSLSHLAKHNYELMLSNQLVVRGNFSTF